MRVKLAIFNVLACKFSDELLDGKTKRTWFLIRSSSDIKQPERFIKTAKECEKIEY